MLTMSLAKKGFYCLLELSLYATDSAQDNIRLKSQLDTYSEPMLVRLHLRLSLEDG